VILQVLTIEGEGFKKSLMAKKSVLMLDAGNWHPAIQYTASGIRYPVSGIQSWQNTILAKHKI